MRIFPAQTGPAGEPVSDAASLTSSNANDVIQEEQNAITSSGLTLIPLTNPADNTQLSQAMARYASGGVFGVDSGAADAYVLSVTGAFTPPDAYFDGMVIRFYAANASTTASTVNAFAIGVVGLVQEDGTALSSGFIDTVVLNEATYDSGAGKFFVNQAAGSVSAPAAASAGFINGLTTANNTIDPAKDIDVLAGSCRDDTDADNMILASTLIKQIDAVWAVGTNAGGLDTGAVAVNTWYYVWLIKRTDTGVVDALFSLSSTAPTMPANYDEQRLIWAVRTDATPDIIAYWQYNGECVWDVLVAELAGTGSGAGALLTVQIPVIGCAHDGTIRLSSTGTSQALITSPDQTNTTPNSLLFTVQATSGATDQNNKINTSTLTGQIRYRTNGTVSGFELYTRGWEIDREAT